MTTIYQRTFIPEPTEDDYIPLPTRAPSDAATNRQLAPAGQGGDEKSVDESTPYHYIIPEDRKLGYISTALLIVNRIIGSGIFATVDQIVRSTDSTGTALFFWVIGGVVSLLCLFAFQFVTSQVTAANVVLFTQYMFLASNGEARLTAPLWLRALTGFFVITGICAIHAFLPRLGIHLGNFLGSFKVVILMVIVCAGFAVLANPEGVLDSGRPSGNYGNFDGVWNATTVDTPPEVRSMIACGEDANNAPVALAQVIFAYTGWENANYVLSEVKNPTKTLKWSAPIAVSLVSILYVLANIAYFAALTKQDMIKGTANAVAVTFFQRMKVADNFSNVAVPVFIGLSALGNVFAASFAFSRAKQELAKEGVLPWSKFFASDWPRQAPTGGLFLHWIFTSLWVLALGRSESGYTFLNTFATYSRTLINIFLGVGLLYLQHHPSSTWREERTSFHVKWPFVVAWTVFNCYLAVAMFVPNCAIPGFGLNNYFAIPVTGICVLIGGAMYWVGFAKVLPLFGYAVETQREYLADGSQVVRYIHITRHHQTLSRPFVDQ
ncbi:hypothetical protein TWF788_010839 [Orbilia oligospora]|uniref:Amino acid permease/ SLC12A domain-containing protein n=1 Tax=Orbilia oligospora TaxID=2813651 RepID=A0A7C8KJ48_ORBOL|nr:hypothetical protein TWF788_010839 [Orbilia oligospora]KAF3204318.1 hypothetical protein TWF679_009881 [Orbilia oligospora]KAF3204319.1 hypothetical protein TWF679_009881 [Orbilia oligospora]KAF3219180.1 hypothetical protein TWF191_007976 [Orbilia oligospora]